jgi:hypothetical protein
MQTSNATLSVSSFDRLLSVAIASAALPHNSVLPHGADFCPTIGFTVAVA